MMSTKTQNNSPVIVKRALHSISRRDIDPDALKVLYRLHRHGFRACLVGGAVRDLLLGKKPKDFDVVTDARPGQVKKLFSNSYLIGRRFRLVHVRFKGNNIIEVATYRKEPDPEEQEEGVDRNNTFGTPEQDAFRRDITINALAYDIANFSIIDYVGGLEDLENRTVRIIGDPVVRYDEDPVRMWRVLRHAARCGFTIEKKTSDAIVSCRHLISTCSGSRLFEEMNKDIKSTKFADLATIMNTYGMFPLLVGKIGEFFETDSAAFAELVRLAGIMDHAILEGGCMSPERMYTLFFWSWARKVLDGCESGEDSGKVLLDAFSDSGASIVFPKALRANVTQTSLILHYMLGAMQTGKMRWSLKKRARYADASYLFAIVNDGSVSGAADPFQQSFSRAFGSPRRRRRPPRKRRSKASD